MINVRTDLRRQFGDVRDQGRRATCLLFTASDLNGHKNASQELSVDYLAHFAYQNEVNPDLDNGFTFGAVASSVHSPGQPTECQYPYDPNDGLRPTYTPPACVGPLETNTAASHPLDTPAVFSSIDGGTPLGLIIGVTESFFSPTVQGRIEFDHKLPPQSSHAVVGLGTGSDALTNDGYILIRNSWGPEWGLNGYAWVPSEYLEQHLIHGFSF